MNKGNNKERLFEMMSKVDKSFKPKLNEEYQTSASQPEYTSTSTDAVSEPVVPEPVAPENNDSQYSVTIIPQTMDSGLLVDPQGETTNFPWSYLHGELEQKARYDKFVFDGELPTDGIHHAITKLPDEDVLSSLYVWTAEDATTGDRKRALVVMNGDTVAMEDAQAKMDAKVDSL